MQQITVIAKCHKCKRKKYFYEKPTLTPYCPYCFTVPMFIDKVIVKKVKSKY